MIKFGGNIGAVKWGSTTISNIYYGHDLVYSSYEEDECDRLIKLYPQIRPFVNQYPEIRNQINGDKVIRFDGNSAFALVWHIGIEEQITFDCYQSYEDFFSTTLHRFNILCHRDDGSNSKGLGLQGNREANNTTFRFFRGSLFDSPNIKNGWYNSTYSINKWNNVNMSIGYLKVNSDVVVRWIDQREADNTTILTTLGCLCLKNEINTVTTNDLLGYISPIYSYNTAGIILHLFVGTNDNKIIDVITGQVYNNIRTGSISIVDKV